MTDLANALTDIDEWARGVLFPLAVLLVVACVGYMVRCLRRILGEFQRTSARVERIENALEVAGLLPPSG